MAELSEADITNILDKLKDHEIGQDIAASSLLLRDIKANSKALVRSIRQGNKAANKFSIYTEKQDTKEDTGDKSKTTTVKKHTSVLHKMSDQLEEIKEKLDSNFKSNRQQAKKQQGFFSRIFKPKGGLSGATADTDVGSIKAAKEKEQAKAAAKQESAKTSSVPWLSLLFAGGAFAAISKAFGIGAGAGVAGGVLSKLLPAVLGPFKVIAKRLPIIGSLISFYEAYKKFQAGGIDNIVFGIMDIAAGIAYAFPLVGTAIGLGLDVLQYFLKNKADEWKAETGDTSFFGSLWDTMMGYLKKTPIFKWFIDTGASAKAFWDNPTWETFSAMGTQFGSILQPLLSTFSMFNSDAGKALGLTDDEGKETGLFTWIADKVDEWIITPVMGFLEGLFVSIGEGIMSLGSGISGFMKRGVDNSLEDGWTKDTLYWMMGWSDKEPEGGHGEIKELKEGKEKMAPGLSKLRKSDQDRIKKWGKLVGGKWSEQEYFNTLDKMSDEQIAEQLQLLKQRATRRGLDFNKVQETEELPNTKDYNLPDYYDREGKIINQSSVNMTTVNNLAVLEPAAAHR
jgi:hypothetical protein